MSTLKVDTILKRTGTGTITVGQSGDTISIPSGATLNSAGTNTLSGIDNVPAFEAYCNTTQDIGDSTVTKITMNTERFDTDNDYDNSTNYRFTPQVAGKYFVYLHIVGFTSTGGNDNLKFIGPEIYKNGSRYVYQPSQQTTYGARQQSAYVSAVIDMNGSSDYLEAYAEIDSTSGTGTVRGNSDGTLNTKFGAYRILGA